jgi:thiamine pyrophosphate-dependent acetolactate synthase large subunit-like protein
VTPDALVVDNLGVVSYVLAGVEDRDKNFYQWGSMGSSLPLGIGMAVSTDDQVTVLDGDGSALMSLGAFVTAGSVEPSNLTVVVLNNDRFATTGGQPTLMSAVDLDDIARACGFRAAHVSTADALEEAYREAVDHDGPSFVVCDVEWIYPEDDRPPDDYNYIKYRFRKATES